MGQLKGARSNVIVTSVVEVGLLLVMATGVTWMTQGSLDVAVLAAMTVMGCVISCRSVSPVRVLRLFVNCGF